MGKTIVERPQSAKAFVSIVVTLEEIEIEGSEELIKAEDSITSNSEFGANPTDLKFFHL